jgi:hypothetical protein
MTNTFRKCVIRQIRFLWTSERRKEFRTQQGIIDSVLSQLLGIEPIKYHHSESAAERAI